MKNLGLVRCFMFCKEVYYAQQGCIYLIKMTVNIVKYYILKVIYFLFYSILKCNVSSLQSSVLHEIIVICGFDQNIFIIIFNGVMEKN